MNLLEGVEIDLESPEHQPQVLVIDDEFMQRYFFQQTLKKMKISCVLAEDGPSGLDKVMARINRIKDTDLPWLNNYKIIFIDYNMP